MEKEFDQEEAKKILLAREEKEKNDKEIERKAVLQQTISILKKKFTGSAVEVYLVGSILKPFGFSTRSDIDIVLKNFQGDRFENWAHLEREIVTKIEIIPFETCPFQAFVLKDGFKVL